MCRVLVLLLVAISLYNSRIRPTMAAHPAARTLVLGGRSWSMKSQEPKTPKGLLSTLIDQRNINDGHTSSLRARRSVAWRNGANSLHQKEAESRHSSSCIKRNNIINNNNNNVGNNDINSNNTEFNEGNNEKLNTNTNIKNRNINSNKDQYNSDEYNINNHQVAGIMSSTPSPLTDDFKSISESLSVDVSAETDSEAFVTAGPLYGADEVAWGRLCSKKISLGYTFHDIVLRCEVWAPLTSTITWSKDSKTIRQDIYQQNYEGFESRSGFTDSGDYSNTTQKMYSSLYLDCVTKSRQGIYELKVVSPSGRTYTRHITLQIVDDFLDPGFWPAPPGPGRMCNTTPTLRRLRPRILSFSKTIKAPVGSNLALPCRHNSLFVKVMWFFGRKRVNLPVTNKGDLLIASVSDTHRGLYICRLVSRRRPRKPAYIDSISTSVRPFHNVVPQEFQDTDVFDKLLS